MFNSRLKTTCLWILLQLGHIDALFRYLDANDKYRMDWTYTTTNITITLTVNTTGWIGLGFSPDGKMAGSDIVTAYVDDYGIVNIEDRFATAEALPALDAQQDYHLVYGSKSNGQVIVQFTRLLDTCDSKDAVITSFTTKVLYAYGSYESAAGLQYHTPANRGYTNLYLLSSEPDIDTADDTFPIDAVPAEIVLPSDSTTYWCSIGKFPNLKSKYHVVKFEPVITPANADIVHHILMYSCTSSVNLNVTSYNCFAPGIDGGNNGHCMALIAGWAIGGEVTYFPAQTGLPVGVEYGPQYVLYQTHYNNEMLQGGRVDASYIRLMATSKLRQFDAGMLSTGAVFGILVPPRQPFFQISGFCTPDCLNTSVASPTEMTIFAVMLHSHLLGKRVTLRQFRDGLELPYVADDPFYDPGYQQTRILDSTRVVLPSDVLQTTCTYNSASRASVTLGGLTTQQEMCQSYILYYPRMDLTDCTSAPNFMANPGDSIYGMMNRNISSFDWTAGTTNGLDGVNWTNEVVQTIENKYTEKSFYTCQASQFTLNQWTPPSNATSALTNNSASAACIPTFDNSSNGRTILQAASANFQAIVVSSLVAALLRK